MRKAILTSLKSTHQMAKTNHFDLLDEQHKKEVRSMVPQRLNPGNVILRRKDKSGNVSYIQYKGDHVSELMKKTAREKAENLAYSFSKVGGIVEANEDCAVILYKRYDYVNRNTEKPQIGKKTTTETGETPE